MQVLPPGLLRIHIYVGGGEGGVGKEGRGGRIACASLLGCERVIRKVVLP